MMMNLTVDLTCPVCLDLYHHPVILPCSHVLCRSPCAENIFGGILIRCPVCRKNCAVSGGISNLPRVITLESIIEKVKTELTQENTNQTRAYSASNFKMTNDRGLNNGHINSCASSPIRCLKCSATPLTDELNMKEAGLKLVQKPVSPNQKIQSYVMCNKSMTCSSSDYEYGANSSCVLEKRRVSYTSLQLIANSSRCDNISEGWCYEATSLHSAADVQVDENDICEHHLNEDELTLWQEAPTVLKRSSSLHADIVHKCQDPFHTLEGLSSVHELRSIGEDPRLAAILLKRDQSHPTFDLRKRFYQTQNGLFWQERIPQRNITHPARTAQPTIDPRRSSRNNTSVALILQPPSSCDVIDSYEITYFSRPGHQPIQILLDAKWSMYQAGHPRKVTFVLIQDLTDGCNYYFSACAVNGSGRGPVSDWVQCRTLRQEQCVVPVPALLENLSTASATSAIISCPCPALVSKSQEISHFILHRQDGDDDRVWLGEELQLTEEHQVHGLHPNQCYQFVALACNRRGECQISEKLWLKTSSV